MFGEGGGRVKEDRRQPLGNLLPLHSTAALRRLRMNYSKRNRVTGFPLRSVFSHALGGKRHLRSGGEWRSRAGHWPVAHPAFRHCSRPAEKVVSPPHRLGDTQRGGV